MVPHSSTSRSHLPPPPQLQRSHNVNDPKNNNSSPNILNDCDLHTGISVILYTVVQHQCSHVILYTVVRYQCSHVILYTVVQHQCSHVILCTVVPRAHSSAPARSHTTATSPQLRPSHIFSLHLTIMMMMSRNQFTEYIHRNGKAG